MKFAHLADVHIGAWREPKLADASTDAFFKAIDICIEEKVDLILIAGDLFNTSLPSIDRLKKVVIKLKELSKKNISVYMIPGSHDFSPSGKTMLDVLEAADLIKNVVKGSIEEGKLKLKFTIDQKTGVKITGLLGKKGMLEKKYYDNLIRKNLENEEGFKIFMFHSAITEFKPEKLAQMDSCPMSFLPKNFSYYAGGHVHNNFSQDVKDYGIVSMPGAIFPCNFKELEENQNGGFYIYDSIVESDQKKVKWVPVQLFNVHSIKIDCNQKTAENIILDLEKKLKNQDFYNTIVTIRFFGILNCTKITDINFRDIFNKIYDKGAYLVLKNTNALTTKQFEEIKVSSDSVNNIEESVIKEHLEKVPFKGVGKEQEFSLIKNLISSLKIEKQEGETVNDYKERIKSESDEVFKDLIK